MNTSDRPAIPEYIKREVRQRCGFGCVICGFPIYEYEHMEEWSIVQRHVASEITLLCRQHHGEKTDHFLPKNIVLEANNNPYNKQSDASPPYNLYYSGKGGKMVIGDNEFTYSELRDGDSLIALQLDNTPLIKFTREGDRLLLSLRYFDNFGREILNIEKNSLKFNLNTWDIEKIKNRLIFRTKSGEIALEIEFETPNTLKIVRGKMFHNGIGLDITQTKFTVINNGATVSGARGYNVNVGLSVCWSSSPISLEHGAIGWTVQLPASMRTQPSKASS